MICGSLFKIWNLHSRIRAIKTFWIIRLESDWRAVPSVRGVGPVLQEGAAGKDDGVHLWPVPDPCHWEAAQEDRTAEFGLLRQGDGHKRDRHLAPEVAVAIHGGLGLILRLEETLDESGGEQWVKKMFYFPPSFPESCARMSGQSFEHNWSESWST